MVFSEIMLSSNTRAITLANKDTSRPEYETILDYNQNLMIEDIKEVPIRKNSTEMCTIIKCRVL